jgi:hypothetical protein
LSRSRLRSRLSLLDFSCGTQRTAAATPEHTHTDNATDMAHTNSDTGAAHIDEDTGAVHTNSGTGNQMGWESDSF